MYTHLTDNELLRQCSNSESLTELELELVCRLQNAVDLVEDYERIICECGYGDDDDTEVVL